MNFTSGTPPSFVLQNANDSIASNITESLEQDWAKDVHKNIMTNAVVLCLYLVIGVAGNSIVLAVYKTQLKHASVERYFIPVLAISDMLATIFGSINNMAWDLMLDNFTNNALCKYFLFTTSNTGFMSLFLLLCIAFQRYLLVCRHHSLSLKHRRLMVGLSFAFANGLALPFAFFYGVNKFYTDGKFIGTRCGRLKKTSLYLPGAIYAVSFVSLMVLTVLALFFFYGRVACTIFKHFKSNPSRKYSINPLPKESNGKYRPGSKANETEYQREDSNIQNTSTEMENIRKDNKTQIVVVGIDNQSIHAVTDNTIQAEDSKNSNSDIVNAQFKSNSILIVKVVEEQSSGVSSGNELRTDMTNITPSNTSLKKTSAKMSKHNFRNKRNRQVKNKFSMMFIVITSVSLLCYIPVGVIVLLEGVFPYFWDNLSSTEFIVVAWLYHTHIINSIVNPLIYAFLDTEFYTRLKALFANCCKL
ncbi:unnamed protein product [Mytilus coruscus]|uniref:G-protein coupled receptors family 1 profile domain-containing protein n=1 Tax=Mytilus coruscus TaxID=42192 RepID=A0A6J8DN44_MYTCO|nr:unnamed protein product [Mytilus coruscus]